MFTYEDLIRGITFDEATAEVKTLATNGGIDTSNWVVGSLPYHNLIQHGFLYSVMSEKAATILKLLNNSTSSGSALTMLADSYYDNQRYSSQTAIGNVIISGSALANLPKTFTPNTFKITDGEVIFQNRNTFTISNATPYVTESFIAAKAGADYNIPSNSTLVTTTTNLGFTITNPPTVGGISGSWLTTFGVNEETDRQLQIRNQLKYSTLQFGDITEDRVKYICLSASLSNTYVSIDDSQWRGQATVNVYVSSDTTTATSASVEAAQLALNTAFFGNSNSEMVIVQAATSVVYNRAITIYYSPTVIDITSLKQTVFGVCEQWVAGIPIGGNDYLPFAANIASLTDLIHNLEDLDNVVKVNITNSSTDITLAINEKLTSPTDWNTVVTFVKLNNIFR